MVPAHTSTLNKCCTSVCQAGVGLAPCRQLGSRAWLLVRVLLMLLQEVEVCW